MDIFDVSITINEFKMEWTLKYSPNDIKFWAPLLDSDIPTQQQCAFMLFEAWGRESVLDHYETWLRLRKAADKLREEHERETARKHEYHQQEMKRLREYHDYYGENDDCGCYDCEEDEYVSTYSNGKRISVRTMRQLNKKYTDFEISLMTWEKYFMTFVFGKGVEQ